MTKAICTSGWADHYMLVERINEPSTRINWTTLSIQLGLPGINNLKNIDVYSSAHN